MLTPATVHTGRADAILAARQVVMHTAFLKNPERFISGQPKPAMPPTAVWINQPIDTAVAA